jgi:hypothetical protein
MSRRPLPHLVRPLCAALLAALLARSAGATPSSEAPSSLLVFPLIGVDASAGVDTVVQLTNTGSASQSVRCVYIDASLTAQAESGFLVTLSPAQPLRWRAGTGLASLPLPGDGSGTIPAVPVQPFGGTLRCVTAQADGTPTAADVLIGVATVERAAPVDGASYAAVGFSGTGASADAPEVLVLGGAQAEYAACPTQSDLPLLLDDASFALGADGTTLRTSNTLIALATCSSRPSGGGAQATINLVVTNEFGQSMAFTRSMPEVLITDLSRLDTSVPQQSIFNAANAGSPHSVVSIAPNSSGSGVLAVALTALSDPNGVATTHRVAVQARVSGDQPLPDLVDLALPTPAPPRCAGDCNGDGAVAINELVLGVNIALGTSPLAMCAALDADASGTVAINELIAAVNAALTGC